MRILLSIATLCLALNPLLASPPPETIQYQGVLRATDGSPVDGSKDMVFRFWTAPSGGQEVLVDQHLAAGSGAVQIDRGLFSVELGSGALSDGAGPGTFTSLRFMFESYTDLYLEVQIESELLTPRVSVGAAPYALNSGAVEGKRLIDLTNDTVGLIGTHAADSAAHHTRYSDAEAISAVGTSNLTPAAPCTAENQVLRWDGASWNCENLATGGGGGGPSGGNALAFEIIDGWGDAWDGVPRGPKNWDEANADCIARGGRLPTIAEVWRVNNTDGFERISDQFEEERLFTSTTDSFLGGKYSLRLSNGTFGSPATFPLYRCIWPGTTEDGYEDDCFGAPDAERCAHVGNWHVFDLRPRLSSPSGSEPLDWPTSAQECFSAEGSLPDLRGVARLNQSAAPIVPAFVWTSNLVNPSSGSAAYSVVGTDPSSDPYSFSVFGRVAAMSLDQQAGCVGRAAGTPNVPAAAPSCEGGCFTPAYVGNAIVADSVSRSAQTHGSAAETCRQLGGRLPRMGEVARLIFGGMDGGTSLAHWSADPAWIGAPQITTYSWSGAENSDWDPVLGTDHTSASSNAPFRCVWPAAVEATPTVCAANQMQNWNGSGFTCDPIANGSSGGVAVPSEFVDAWGNAWDLDFRSGGTYAVAQASCESLGARLPTATEYWRVRNGNGLVPAIGDGSDTQYMWAYSPSAAPLATVIRVSDGNTIQEENNNEHLWRCIWPASKGNALSGGSCNADPSESCFQAGRLRTDRFDRPALPYPVAALECELDGGQLPLLDEITELIHAGLANGSGDSLWTENPVVNGSDERLAVVGWSGTGSTSWTYASPATNGVGQLDSSTGVAKFRCVFSDRHDY